MVEVELVDMLNKYNVNFSSFIKFIIVINNQINGSRYKVTKSTNVTLADLYNDAKKISK